MNIRTVTAAAFAGALTLLAGSSMAQTQSERVAANDSESYAWTPDTTGDVIICIDGDGDTNLDLFIHDAEGNVVASDSSGDDNELVRFRCVQGTQYTIEIRNLGDVFNEFELEMAYVDEAVSDIAQAGQTISYDYPAPQGVGEVTATLHGGGGTDMDLKIYDSRNRLVVQGLSLDDHERLTFECTPGQTYRIEVSNLGNAINAFTLDIQE